MPSLATLERRLAAQLARDRARRRNLRPHPTDLETIIVSPSGTAVGLAIAIQARTGEPYEGLMDRVAHEYEGEL